MRDAVEQALGRVFDPELDEPITDLGFVRSVAIEGRDVTVHLRLPTSFCSPNFAYLMASDAKDNLAAIPDVGAVAVLLDDHHDSDLINAGLAADAGYRGTFGHEADDSLDELRAIFRRKAHTAAMERALSKLLKDRPTMSPEDLHDVLLSDLPSSPVKDALERRREALGFPAEGPVMVADDGTPWPREEIPIRLRFAKSVRISIDGNAHFCRGLLRTRYPESAADQAPRPTGDIDFPSLERTAS